MAGNAAPSTTRVSWPRRLRDIEDCKRLYTLLANEQRRSQPHEQPLCFCS